jgi:hypothetical protein
VPDLGVKLHDRRAEGILARDLDVNKVGGALVWRVGRPHELASQMCEIVAISSRLNDNLGVLVVLDIGNLLGNAPASVGGGHGSALTDCVAGTGMEKGSRVRLKE